MQERIHIDTQGLDESPRAQIAARLQEAIDQLKADVARVELWASALTSFSQPVPDYSPNKRLAFNQLREMGSKSPSTGRSDLHKEP